MVPGLPARLRTKRAPLASELMDLYMALDARLAASDAGATQEGRVCQLHPIAS